jgi:hypothetical protein
MNTDRVKLTDDYRDWLAYFKKSSAREYRMYTTTHIRNRQYSNVYLVMILGRYGKNDL